MLSIQGLLFIKHFVAENLPTVKNPTPFRFTKTYSVTVPASRKTIGGLHATNRNQANRDFGFQPLLPVLQQTNKALEILRFIICPRP